MEVQVMFPIYMRLYLLLCRLLASMLKVLPCMQLRSPAELPTPFVDVSFV